MNRLKRRAQKRQEPPTETPTPPPSFQPRQLLDGYVPFDPLTGVGIKGYTWPIPLSDCIEVCHQHSQADAA